MLLQYSDTSLEIPSLVGAMYSEKHILVNTSSTSKYILDLRVPDEGYSRNVSFTLN
jgi:hypothetical protein